jgi:predicted enzyme related to lactoylglutathione lyase
MAKVIGLGGIFFKSRDPKGLSEWYAKHLGLPVHDWGGATFDEDESRKGKTLWSPFAADTTYFAPSTQPYMINFRVDDLDGLLAQLREAGVEVDPRVDDSEFGRFGWIMDPEGTRIELWQPPAS